MKQITIHTQKVLRRIKPMHGVGGGPLTDNFTYNAVEEFRAAGIPYCRTHDIEYPFGSGEFVDIHCIFPDLTRDVNDPTAYNFACTDLYLQYILDSGAKPFYRLGSSIEHQPVKRYVYPPKDNTQWAQICSHIISHYNEGWNNGFHMGIEYWEIWNEPENTDTCFIGTEDELFRLYDTAATLLKKEHPSIKIGGLAFTDPTNPLAEKFLAHVRESKVPIDFFSWHGYSCSPENSGHYAEVAEELLKKYGFENIESIYGEWNYVVDWGNSLDASNAIHRSAFCGAYIAGVMSVMQKHKVDLTMYYSVHSTNTRWNGLFSPGRTKCGTKMCDVIREKPYYVFPYWNDLYRRGTEIEAVADDKLFVTAAKDDTGVSVLVSYFYDPLRFGLYTSPDEDIEIRLPDYPFAKATLNITDDIRTNENIAFDGRTFTMHSNSFALLRFENTEAVSN